MSAWACETGITLAQCFTEEKSNEITATPELLKMLSLQGAVVTIDAMGTQREIADQIIEAGGGYLLSVKANQGNLHKEIVDQFEFATRQTGTEKLSPDNWSQHLEQGMNRGRLEKRHTIACHNLDWMDCDIGEAWRGVACVILVTRTVRDNAGKWRSETHHYMGSLKDRKAEELQQYIRGHWLIENSCHWVMDTLFREDHNQTGKRNAAKNLSTLRRVSLNALKQAPDHTTRKRPGSLTKKQLRAAHDAAYLEEILFLV